MITSSIAGFHGLWMKPCSPSVQFVLPVRVWAEGWVWPRTSFARAGEFASSRSEHQILLARGARPHRVHIPPSAGSTLCVTPSRLSSGA